MGTLINCEIIGEYLGEIECDGNDLLVRIPFGSPGSAAAALTLMLEDNDEWPEKIPSGLKTPVTD